MINILEQMLIDRVLKYLVYCKLEGVKPINFTIKKYHHDMLAKSFGKDDKEKIAFLYDIPLFVVDDHIEVSHCELCGIQYETEILHVCQGLEKDHVVKTLIEEDPLIKKIKEIEQRLDRIEGDLDIIGDHLVI